MFKRLELHNHTTESDSSLTPTELTDYMAGDHVDAFAITDHNTISAHQMIQQYLADTCLPISCIYGMEYTTYYGHILCLNLKEYIPWENINLHKPELLFQAVKEKGALAGVAHPYSYGHPFSRGCRFDMTIHDFSAVDFIEIFNNPEPLHEVNERGLLWWEELVLAGHPLAATCGMDLHGKWDMANQYATFIEGSKEGNIERELNDAIKHQKTWVSKNPILLVEKISDNTLEFSLKMTDKSGYTHQESDPYILTLRTKKSTIQKQIFEKTKLQILISNFEGASIVIPKLFQRDTGMEHLVCVAPVIHI